jgi:hypothetical protein
VLGIESWRQVRHGFVIVTVAVSLMIAPGPATSVAAKEFDVTGTIDCGALSGRKCDFADWDTGPVIGVLTEDISGTRERVLIDASWVKSDLTDFDQDDFIWLTVRDGIGPNLQATGVVEHHCTDGRFSLGIVNQGQSSGNRCRR